MSETPQLSRYEICVVYGICSGSTEKKSHTNHEQSASVEKKIIRKKKENIEVI